MTSRLPSLRGSEYTQCLGLRKVQFYLHIIDQGTAHFFIGVDVMKVLIKDVQKNPALRETIAAALNRRVSSGGAFRSAVNVLERLLSFVPDEPGQTRSGLEEWRRLMVEELGAKSEFDLGS